MPSSKDRRRVEITTGMYDRLKLLADSEERTVTDVVHDMLRLGLTHYQSTWLPHFYFDRFNQQARQALDLSKDEARRFGHDFVGTEHLLLGLLREDEGIAAQVLRRLWIDLEKTRLGVTRMLAYATANAPAASPASSAPASPVSQAAAQTAATSVASEEPADAGETAGEIVPTEESIEIGYTARMRKVMTLAVDEAQRLGHDYVGTEHLLLALEREGEGLAAGLLRTFGALGRIREFTLAALRQRETANPEE